MKQTVAEHIGEANDMIKEPILTPNGVILFEGKMPTTEKNKQTVEESYEFTRQEVYEWICEHKLLNHKEFKKILLKEKL